MLTKAVNQELILRHAGTAGLSFESGRAQTAPLLDGFSWSPNPAPAARKGAAHGDPADRH